MKIKTYQAATMQDALQAIKAELGADAVILSTKQHPQGKTRLGYKMVEVTAAIDIEAPRVSVRSNRHAGPQQVPIVPDQTRHDVSNTAATMPFGEILRASLSADPQAVLLQHNTGSSGRDVDRRDEEWQSLRDELKGIQARLDSREKAAEHGPWPPHAMPYYERLIERGLEVRTAQELLHDVCPELPSGVSAVRIQQALQRVIAGQIKTSGPLMNKEDRKKTIILIGPTGVGKTTSIAKLAAYYRQHERRSVALITLDTYRIAAVDQLRVYADLIGVTLDVALTRGDALRCMARRNDADLILVDTAGRSPGDRVGMTEVHDMLSLNHPVDVHLVLSATTRERDLQQYTNHYRGIPFNRVLLTKLDETTGVGGAFDLMRRTGVPLSYFCVGQRVPEDIELARPERLAEILVGESGRLLEESARTGMMP
ncbi:MAG: putative Flagellar biosynthetic protein FlhF, binding [Nitrospira sp.]|jgi:flagellar biosynthesis protein FlhF|nr:putative Flagellar biosynthetic protein FlhF, binding [Nitrospira sp.]